MVIVPLLVMFPDRLALARMPVEPFDPWMAMAPSLVTLLLVLIVTAAPLVGLTEPVELIRTSSLVAPVVTGVVIAVLITVSAAAGPDRPSTSAETQVVASKERIESSPIKLAAAVPRTRREVAVVRSRVNSRDSVIE